MEKLTNIIESLLYVSGKEISITDIAEKLEITKNEVKLAVLELQEKYSGDCGLYVLFFNDKVQFGSNPDYGEAVSAVLNPIRERELSRSMLEVAAIIAYKQPVTRADLEELRGNSEYAIQNLLKLGVIEVVGKKDAVGRPSLFGTTDKFLKRFQISSLEDLPDYDDLLSQVKLLKSRDIDDNYLYRKDVYVDDGSDDELPPQRQFVPKEVAVTEEEPAIADLKDEEVPDFLKDEDVELIETDVDDEDYNEDEDYDEDYNEDEDYDEIDDDDTEDEDFDEYQIDDEEYEDEAEDDTDYEDEEEEDDGYEEDDV